MIKEGEIELFVFVENVREERDKEIKEYESKGIGFIKKNHYKLLRRISIEKEGATFEFEVRVDFKDVRFYIIKNSSYIYLSIYEIYELLNNINLNFDIDITEELKTFYNNTDEDKFEYNGKKYTIPKSPSFKEKYNVNIPNSNINISCTEFFILIFLIQEKSNYLWSISEKEVTFNNGVVYLMVVLLNYKDNDKLLNDLGWYYSDKENKYMKNELSVPNEDDEEYEAKKAKVARKYYLTETEMNCIL